MLTFNDLLALEHVDVARVRLVRHEDRRLAAGRLYEAWRNDRASFESYQAVQARAVFGAGDLLASFIVTDAGKTVFVRMSSVDGVGTCPERAVDALLKRSCRASSRSARSRRSYPCRRPVRVGGSSTSRARHGSV